MNKAKNDLKSLTDKFPDNDKYKNWIAVTQTYSIDIVLKIMTYIIAAAVLTTVIFDKQDLGVFYDIILYLGAVAIILSVTLEIIKWMIKKKYKTDG